MVQKRVDSRIQSQIETSISWGHRCMFGIIGDNAVDQVINIHQILRKATQKAQLDIAWLYNSKLAFSSAQQKRSKELRSSLRQKLINEDEADLIDIFFKVNNLSYCKYDESHRVLGRSYDMVILQDFENLTPNIMAKTIETCRGPGIVLFLVKKLKDLKDIFNISLESSKRFLTGNYNKSQKNFMNRMVRLMQDSEGFYFLDDSLNVLTPPKTSSKNEAPPENISLLFKKTLNDFAAKHELEQKLIESCATMDQARALVSVVDAINSHKQSFSFLSAARGRGKSATIGMAIALAASLGLANIYISSPSLSNVQTVFEFVKLSLEKLSYKPITDFTVLQTRDEELGSLDSQIVIDTNYRQVIQWIPSDRPELLSNCDLLCIDEAAALPMPLVRKLLGNYHTIMSSTISGYEGTGRSLSIKLIDRIRNKDNFREIILDEPIRYSQNDPIEALLNNLLLLDAKEEDADFEKKNLALFHVQKDVLFSYSETSEELLRKIQAILVTSHYRNSPDDLQLLADAPAHELFILIDKSTLSAPEPLCVCQIAFEGKIPADSLLKELSKGSRGSGDLIPWSIGRQWPRRNFSQLFGARVVRIATHSQLQSRSLGRIMITALNSYFSGKLYKGKPYEKRTLITPLSKREPENINWFGTSFGLSPALAKFWLNNQFKPLYIRQQASQITGEYSAIFAKNISGAEIVDEISADFAYGLDFYAGSPFKHFPALLVAHLLKNKEHATVPIDFVTAARLERLNRVGEFSYERVNDVCFSLAHQYNAGKLPVELTLAEKVVMLSLWTQMKSLDETKEEFESLQNEANFDETLQNMIRKLFTAYFSVTDQIDE